MGFLLYNTVVKAVEGRIDPETEEMLVILSQNTWRNNIPPFASLSRIDRDCACYTRGSCFDGDAAGHIELICKDVFVVGKRDDELNHKSPISSDHPTSSTIVGMFPENSVVLFMHAHDVLGYYAVSSSIVHNRIEILNVE